ncbi:unnamed protein product [Darwinula stevensoni]|uniref:Uncharacterized protein n=1 Tax=Darwinula stevensoni TaxID=69355 RepID=A0A7R9FRY4_9CRUS|nr:unnamed protein product [Darwinula stevensoni]CAG0902154.1 unnamed protein product [Darwinula stevensoni]
MYDPIGGSRDEGATDPDTLTLTNVTKEDAAWYVCIARNTVGETRGQAYLEVLTEEESKVLPSFASQDSYDRKNITILLGVMGPFVVFLLIISLFMYQRMRRAKQKKKETVQVLTHEFKRIIVEKQGPHHLTPLVGYAPESWASSSRPTFHQIVEEMDRILGNVSPDLYMNLDIPHIDTPQSSPETSAESLLSCILLKEECSV